MCCVCDSPQGRAINLWGGSPAPVGDQGVIQDFEVKGGNKVARFAPRRLGACPPPWNFSRFVFEMGIRFRVSKLGLWVCIFLCARASKTCVLLDFDLKYLGTICLVRDHVKIRWRAIFLSVHILTHKTKMIKMMGGGGYPPSLPPRCKPTWQLLCLRICCLEGITQSPKVIPYVYLYIMIGNDNLMPLIHLLW